MKQLIFFIKIKLLPIPCLYNKFLISRFFDDHLDSPCGPMSAMKRAGTISGKTESDQIMLKMKFYYTNGSWGETIIL